MTLVQRCPGRSWAQLVWLRASRPCQPPYMLACVACALPISVSRTLLCAPGLRDVHELTWAAVTQVSARAYVASLLGAKRGIPGRGGPSVAILGAKLPAQLSSSPAVLSQADPQVIFLPRPAPSRVMGPKTSCSNSCSNPGPKPVATPPGGGEGSLHFSSLVPSAAPASRGQTLIKSPTRAGKLPEAWAREGKENRDRAPFPPGSHEEWLGRAWPSPFPYLGLSPQSTTKG